MLRRVISPTLCLLLCPLCVPAAAQNAALPTAQTQSCSTLPAESPTAARLETQALTLVNRERLKAGLAALTLRAELTQAARAHAIYMSRVGSFDHVDSQGHTMVERVQAAGYGSFSVVAENLAMNGGFENPGAEAVSGWMKSDGHRANILNIEFVETGIGVSFHGNRVYFTQVFAAPPRAVAPMRTQLERR